MHGKGLQVIIDLSTEKQIRAYVDEKIKSSPFSKETIDEAFAITEKYQEAPVDETLNIDNVIAIIDSLDKSLTTLQNLDAAVYAIISIKRGKLLNILVNMVKLHNKKLSKEDRIDFSELVGKIFPTKYKQARRYALMRVAKMKDAEEFSFLGIEKLIEISRVVDFNSSPHPIKDMLEKFKYTFDLSKEETAEDFKFKISNCINFEKLQAKSLTPNMEFVEQLSKREGIITEKRADEIAGHVLDGKTLYDSMFGSKAVKTAASTRLTDSLSSFNDFEAAVQELTDIIDDILYYETTPTYDAKFTKGLMYVLMKMEADLLEMWGEKWGGFKKKDEKK